MPVIRCGHHHAVQLLPFDHLPEVGVLTNRFTCRTLSRSSSAASRCVMSFFLAFLSVTSRHDRLGSSVVVLPAPSQLEVVKATFVLCPKGTLSFCCHSGSDILKNKAVLF